MAEVIKKRFRVEHRDMEVVYKDDLGVEKFLYVALSSPAGPVDVDAEIAKHLAEEEQIARNVKAALDPKPKPAPEPEAPAKKKGKK